MKNSDKKAIEEFLRPGVLFKTWDGKWFVYCRNKHAYKVEVADSYNIRLTSNCVPKYERVIEAYDTTGAAHSPLSFITMYDIIMGWGRHPRVVCWKRPIKLVTVAELEQLFGCEVRIVKERSGK